jgi:hypothetical protein
MVDMVVQNEPAGTTFRNSGERNAYLQRVASRLDKDESYARWWMASAEYNRCMAQRRSGCRNPGPQPR